MLNATQLSNSLYRATRFANFAVNHLSGGGVMQITTLTPAHQFRALARRERKSFNRKSKEVEELRLIYLVEREDMLKPFC